MLVKETQKENEEEEGGEDACFLNVFDCSISSFPL